ncbi:hypothetical protein BV0002_002 [Streptococcus phage BV-0002]|nr:hypothetical protein BV0002_002 [Streptococcus phage BV-0002]
MDITKLKGFAIAAAGKAKDGAIKANELRKKASQERKMVLPPALNFRLGTPTAIRKTIDGKYYIGFYSETPELYEFVNLQFDGSRIIEKTVTKGKTIQRGRSGSVLGGAAIGTVLVPGVGTIVGGMTGGARKKIGTINTTGTTTSEEIPGKATVALRNIQTGEVKTLKTKLTQVQYVDVNNFFK